MPTKPFSTRVTRPGGGQGALWSGVFASMVVSGLVVATAASQHSTADRSRSLLTPSLVGRDIFISYCAPCHGRHGTGDGPVASALKTPPANLTLLTRQNGGTFPRSRVEAFVTNGQAAIGAHGSSEMPVWGPTFRALEPSNRLVKVRIKSVVEYVGSIQIE